MRSSRQRAGLGGERAGAARALGALLKVGRDGWAARADNFMERLGLKNCSVGSSQLGNEIGSQFSNPLFQKKANETAKSFLREQEQRPGGGERRKPGGKLLPACEVPHLLPLLRLKGT